MMFEDALSLPKPSWPGVIISHYQHKAVLASASTFYTLNVVILSLVLSRMTIYGISAYFPVVSHLG